MGVLVKGKNSHGNFDGGWRISEGVKGKIHTFCFEASQSEEMVLLRSSKQTWELMVDTKYWVFKK